MGTHRRVRKGMTAMLLDSLGLAEQLLVVVGIFALMYWANRALTLRDLYRREEEAEQRRFFEALATPPPEFASPSHRTEASASSPMLSVPRGS